MKLARKSFVIQNQNSTTKKHPKTSRKCVTQTLFSCLKVAIGTSNYFTSGVKHKSKHFSAPRICRRRRAESSCADSEERMAWGVVENSKLGQEDLSNDPRSPKLVLHLPLSGNVVPGAPLALLLCFCLFVTFV